MFWTFAELTGFTLSWVSVGAGRLSILLPAAKDGGGWGRGPPRLFWAIAFAGPRSASAWGCGAIQPLLPAGLQESPRELLRVPPPPGADAGAGARVRGPGAGAVPGARSAAVPPRGMPGRGVYRTSPPPEINARRGGSRGEKCGATRGGGGDPEAGGGSCGGGWARRQPRAAASLLDTSAPAAPLPAPLRRSRRGEAVPAPPARGGRGEEAAAERRWQRGEQAAAAGAVRALAGGSILPAASSRGGGRPGGRGRSGRVGCPAESGAGRGRRAGERSALPERLFVFPSRPPGPVWRDSRVLPQGEGETSS